MTIKWEYDIEGTVEEVIQLIGMVKPVDVVQEDPPKAVKTAGRKKKEVDVGKIQALRKAGWTIAEIADEMQIGQSTVYTKLKEAAA